MWWELAWVPRAGGPEVLAECRSRPEAMIVATAFLGEDCGWEDVGDETWRCLLPVRSIYPGGSRGELLIYKQEPAEELGLGWHERRENVDGEDYEFSGKVDVLIDAIRIGAAVGFQYLTKKKEVHPGLFKPEGWRIFPHTHPFRGGETICAFGYCFYYHERRWYAVKRMSEVRSIPDLDAELQRLGWTREPPADGDRSASRVPLVAGDIVYHRKLGLGTVVTISPERRRLTVRFRERGPVRLLADVAHLERVHSAEDGL